MDQPANREIFDRYYFATSCGRPYGREPAWLNFFGQIAERIQGSINPPTVLEVGCAWGFLVEGLRQRGIQTFGVDISEYAIRQAHPSVKPYCWVGSLADPLPGRFDLLVCIEVLEHMPADQAERAIANLCALSGDILFSSTPFDYHEATHFNVRPPEFWSEAFARHGFFRDVDFDASFITPWAVRYCKRFEALPRLVREYERRFFELWKENVDLRQLAGENREQLSQLHDRLSRLEIEAPAASQELAQIKASRTWRILRSWISIRMRLAPPGSRRERWLRKIGLLS